MYHNSSDLPSLHHRENHGSPFKQRIHRIESETFKLEAFISRTFGSLQNPSKPQKTLSNLNSFQIRQEPCRSFPFQNLRGCIQTRNFPQIRPELNQIPRGTLHGTFQAHQKTFQILQPSDTSRTPTTPLEPSKYLHNLWNPNLQNAFLPASAHYHTAVGGKKSKKRHLKDKNHSCFPIRFLFVHL